jgi:hypothetical protein
MWQRIAIVLAVGLECLPAPETRGADPSYADTLLSELDWVRFDLVMGRMLATGHRTKQDRQRAVRQGPDGAAETLTVTLDRGLVSLHYDYRTESRQLSLRVVRRDQLELEAAYGSADAGIIRVLYVQIPGQDVTLSIEEPGRPPQAYAGRSLWHLWLAQPTTCQMHLGPLMSLFQCDARIDAEAREIRARLLDCSPHELSTSRAEVERLVTELRAPDFGVRQGAARELRARGPTVLGFLQELDLTTLDAEQRFRVRSIQREIIAEGEDTPARMVSWLMSDKAAWLALLHDDAPERRQHALRQLARLCDQGLDLDPHTGDLRDAAQVAELQTQLLRR